MRRVSFAAEKNRMPERFDVPFVVMTVIMCGVGITTLYSGSTGYAELAFGNPMYFVNRQLVNLVIGTVAMIVLSAINLEVLRKQLPKLVLIAIIVAILPFIPGIGLTRNGATRWIKLGPSQFQPSELVKIGMVFFLANLFAKKYDRFDEPEVSVYPAAFMSFLFIAIVYLQNDFSTAMFILCIVLSMFYIAGVPMSWFVKLFLVLLPLVVIMVLSKEYRIKRVLSFLNPDSDPLDSGYQVNAALKALSEGGFWGRGLGNGIRKISSIPEVQADFIFAVWCEEMGFLGVLMYFGMLVAFSIRGFWVSFTCSDRFRCYLGFGCTLIIFVQSLMNCGVVVRFLPATGVTLPFFSSGGSSLLITLCLCGLIINVSRRKPEGELQNG
jgi:cell division protein FtsW